MYQTVTALYFSPTGNTRKSVEAMAKAITPQIQSVDLTALKPVEPHTFSAQDLVIFGAPVYGGRIPAVARQRFLNFQGQGTPCLVAVTYGNRDFDDALLELAELAASQGFGRQGRCGAGWAAYLRGDSDAAARRGGSADGPGLCPQGHRKR